MNFNYSNPRVMRTRNFSIDNHRAVETYNVDAFGNQTINFYTREVNILQNDTSIIALGTIVYNKEKEREIDLLFDEIISTFKFVN